MQVQTKKRLKAQLKKSICKSWFIIIISDLFLFLYRFSQSYIAFAFILDAFFITCFFPLFSLVCVLLFVVVVFVVICF